MSNRTGQIILIGMLAGVVLGALGGYFLGEQMLQIKFLGVIFLNALKLIVVPLIILSMIVGVTSLGDIRKLGRTAGKTLLYFLGTTTIAVLLGLVLVNIIRPGVGAPMIGTAAPEMITDSAPMSLIDIVVSMVPENFFKAASEGQVLGLIIFALIFGGALTTLGAGAKSVIDILETLNRAIMKIVELIIYFAPVGVFALIGGIVAENRESLGQLTSGLGWYTLTVIAGLVIHGVIILPLILSLLGKRNPWKYVINMGQVFATSFTTSSSSATLPVNMTAVIEKNKVDKRAGSFVLPLGATINMDGTALYEAVAAVFIAQVYGIDLTIGQQVIIFITATLASIGAAGIPHAGTVTMVFVLSAVGLPIEGIGLIWAVDWFLDRCRTTVNVWGDAVGAAVISETGEIKAGEVILSRISPAPETRTEKTYVRRDRQERPERMERRERPERGERQDRRDRPERTPRQGRFDERPREQRRRDYPSKGRRNDQRGGFRKERSDEPRKQSPSPDYIKKELEEIRKQKSPAIPVAGFSQESEPIDAMSQETGQKDSFFDIDVSKIDFFPGDKKEPDEEKGVETAPEPETPPDRELTPDSEPQVKQEITEKDGSEEEDDSWGRIKKKHPSR
ncbi:MAG: dicarboxylate/amino acid:cation symporter [Candidatus Zixiibacteriota bacterium]